MAKSEAEILSQVRTVIWTGYHKINDWGTPDNIANSFKKWE